MNPRKPTNAEKKELLEYEYLAANPSDELKEEIDKWYMTVFDNYQTDYPGYTGKVLVILPTHDLYPEIVEIYVWHEGRITRVRNKEEMGRIVDKNLAARK